MLLKNFIPFVPAVSWEIGAEEKKKLALSFCEVSYGIKNAFYSAATAFGCRGPESDFTAEKLTGWENKHLGMVCVSRTEMVWERL